MYARIICGQVAELTEDFPTPAPGECAHIEECDPEVQPGWTWTPEGITPPEPPEPSEPDPNAEIDAQITALEATVTQRRLREAVLTSEGAAWLADLEAQIAALRAQRV